MLNINNLSIGYKDNIVLENISFEFNEGEIYGLFGDSGRGKTTLCNTLVGINKPLGGDIELDNEKLFIKNKYQKKFHSLIHLIPQHPHLSLDKAHRVKYLLHELCSYYHLFNNLEEENNKILELFKKVSLNEGILLRKVNELSGGEAQRILLVEALLLNSKVIILDESLSMLDSINKVQIIELYKKINKEYNNILIVISHEIDLLKRITEKVYKL